MTVLRRRALAAVGMGVALAFAGGCGGDDDEQQPATKPEPAKVDPNKDPYQVTCGDIKDPIASATLTRRATNTLAIELKLRNRTQFQVAQSLFVGFQEVCKSKDAGYKPAKDAVAGVKSGKYKAEL